MVNWQIGVFVEKIIYILECYAPGGWSHLQQGVYHTAALPFTLKKYLKAKEELWKLKYFTTHKYNVQKIL